MGNTFLTLKTIARQALPRLIENLVIEYILEGPIPFPMVRRHSPPPAAAAAAAAHEAELRAGRAPDFD